MDITYVHNYGFHVFVILSSWAIYCPEVVNGSTEKNVFFGGCGQRCQEGAAGRRQEPRKTQGKWTAAISPVDSGEECYRMGWVRVRCM